MTDRNTNLTAENDVAVEKKSIKKKSRFDFISVILVAAIVAVSVISVNCYIEQYEKNYRSSRLESQLDSVKNDYELLEVEYQRLCDMGEVSDYVRQELSMKEMSDYQIQYIQQDSGNSMLVMNDDNDNGFITRIAKTFSVILEYFE